MNYWYNSLLNTYPRTGEERAVLSVQCKATCYIVEMTREATPKEIDACKLVYLGHGYWKDRHIQEKILKLECGETM